MHVNDKQFIQSFDLGSSSNNFRTNQEGSISGRTATMINSSNHTALLKSATSANNQSAKITSQNQPTNSDKPLKVSALKSDSIRQQPMTIQSFDSCPDYEFMMNQINHVVQMGASHDQVGILVGGKVVKSDSPELHGKNPDELGRSLFIFSRENGQRALAIEEDQLDSIQNLDLTYIDANGQTQQYDIIAINQSISNLLVTVLDKFVDTHITPNLAPREKEKEHTKTEVDDKPTTHTPPQSPRYEYNPKTIEQKNDEEFANNDVSKLLSENPKVILRNVLEAESLLEAKKMNQERAQEAKKKLIDEQEERREIRHEGYKQDDIKQGKQRHEILNETLHHQESERPASISTVQQGKNDEG